MRGIPLEGNVGLALGDPRATGWGNVEELLAILNEQVDAANRMFLAVHSDKGSRPPKPLKIPRPGALGATTAVPSMSPPEEVARFFGRGYDPTRAG